MKDAALKIIEVAFAIFPPLVGLFRRLDATTPADDPDRPLLDEVLARVPAESESAKVARDLEA